MRAANYQCSWNFDSHQHCSNANLQLFCLRCHRAESNIQTMCFPSVNLQGARYQKLPLLLLLTRRWQDDLFYEHGRLLRSLQRSKSRMLITQMTMLMVMVMKAMKVHLSSHLNVLMHRPISCYQYSKHRKSLTSLNITRYLFYVYFRLQTEHCLCKSGEN